MGREPKKHRFYPDFAVKNSDFTVKLKYRHREGTQNHRSLSRTKNRNNNYSITFQAQGTGMSQNIRKGTTQESKVIQVFSDKPITKKQALGALSILYSELNQKEQANMLGTFTEAAEWIESVKGGYVSPYKSIQQKNDPTGDRIDMIFRGGYNLTDN